MASTDHLNCTTQPKLTKLAARTVLAAGLGMAVMGLTAVMANADPVPPNNPDPNPGITATLRPTPPAPPPHSESGICNGALPPGQLPPPGYCG
jgi:hypothetical protein